MKLPMANLEKYRRLSDEQLRNELLQLHVELNKVAEDEVDDHELQAAIALAQSKKIEYTMRRQQLKKLLKTVHELLAMRT